MNHNQKYVTIVMIYQCEILVLTKFLKESPYMAKYQDTKMLKNGHPASKNE